MPSGYKAKKQTKNYYNRSAQNYYLEHVTLGTAAYYEFAVMSNLLSDLIRELSSKKIACDLGCGTGFYTKIVSSKIEFTIATDISMNMLKKARKKDIDLLCLCDAEHLPFRSQSMDLMVSFALLEHVPNPEHVAEEMFRVLRTKGRCICMTPNPRFPTLRIRRKEASKQYETFIRPEELKRIFRGILEYRTIYMWPGLWRFSDLLKNVSDQLARHFLHLCEELEKRLLRRLPLIRDLGYLQVVYAVKE